MKEIKAIFLELPTSEQMMLMGRYILIPLVILLVYYLLLMLFIRLKFIKPIASVDNFYLKFQFTKIYAINTTLLLCNGYWFYLLYSNAFSEIEWGFVFELKNIYLQLAPFVIANALLIMLYTRTQKTILNIL